MWTILLDAIGWNDPARRTALIRGLVAAIGYLINQGQIPMPAFVYQILNDPGMAMMVGSFFMPAGDKSKG
mgnify:CR=1